MQMDAMQYVPTPHFSSVFKKKSEAWKGEWALFVILSSSVLPRLALREMNDTRLLTHPQRGTPLSEFCRCLLYV